MTQTFSRVDFGSKLVEVGQAGEVGQGLKEMGFDILFLPNLGLFSLTKFYSFCKSVY